MSRSNKPRVLTRCVANHYAVPNERIVEFSFPNGDGGLIQFFAAAEGNYINVYNVDATVRISVPVANLVNES